MKLKTKSNGSIGRTFWILQLGPGTLESKQKPIAGENLDPKRAQFSHSKLEERSILSLKKSDSRCCTNSQNFPLRDALVKAFPNSLMRFGMPPGCHEKCGSWGCLHVLNAILNELGMKLLFTYQPTGSCQVGTLSALDILRRRNSKVIVTKLLAVDEWTRIQLERGLLLSVLKHWTSDHYQAFGTGRGVTCLQE